MKLENQVCSLELAKRLKELKVKQDSLWCWNPVFIVDKKRNPDKTWDLTKTKIDKYVLKNHYN